MYARLRPNRSPILLPIRMKAAETSASSAIADWTPLAVVSRSSTTAEIDTFINEVSTTRTNIAAASRSIRRRLPLSTGAAGVSPSGASDTLVGDLAAQSPDHDHVEGDDGQGPERVVGQEQEVGDRGEAGDEDAEDPAPGLPHQDADTGAEPDQA